jgi:hypothetical protein
VIASRIPADEPVHLVVERPRLVAEPGLAQLGSLARLVAEPAERRLLRRIGQRSLSRVEAEPARPRLRGAT